jgi:hypothetical protein
MMNLTPELLLQLHPDVYRAVYRLDFTEAKNDPATRKQIAEEYLKSLSVQALPASPTVKTVPHPETAAISATQAEINRLLGLTTQDYLKYRNVGLQDVR